jgi:hypothetical protein
MDPETLSRSVEKRVLSDPIVAIAPFNLKGQASYNLVLGDEAGNVN